MVVNKEEFFIEGTQEHEDLRTMDTVTKKKLVSEEEILVPLDHCQITSFRCKVNSFVN
jgi:hypothetical protein